MAHAGGHWHIETKSHHVRDTTFGEDACQVRTRGVPHALAAVRNLVIGAMRLAGHANIAHARRWYARDTHRTPTLFNITPNQPELDESRT